ncbi:LysR family transcriptional regulator [Alteromonas ponticola]|uniref:LysR family transcriptional regulator n=1 Tax=Alteromonas ponticola TaxID=2720613 RepID=A0ABX1R0B1_9ALTE|nr:LysR family transcriptional regulator [Alteromonas ponticola]NMH59183.1 LysR family transcriptional regulator [Alteromonas ponticola]
MRNNDLNLLMIFDAIMTEGAITRAADRLAMTQPAVSNALSRMRTAWKDELFVKDGRGIQPTAFALNLWSQIKEPLGLLEDAVNPSHFDPATARRTFRISASDIVVDMLWGPLRRIIETEAPGINIYAMPNAALNTEKVLNDAEADLVIGKFPMADNVVRTEQILEPSYVCVMRPDHPLAKEQLSLQGFADADHLLVSITGDVTGITDQALMNVGLSRRVAMSVNHFHAVAPLLQQSDLICVVPSIAVEKEIFSGELAVFETPIELAKTPLGVLWHKRQDHDLGLQWLRRLVTRFLRERSAQHQALLSRCCRKGYCPDALKELISQRTQADCSLAETQLKGIQ